MSKSSNFSIVCPGCETEIQVDSLLRDEIREEVEANVSESAKDARKEIAALRKKLNDERLEFAENKRQFDELVDEQVSAVTREIKAKAEKKAEDNLRIELRDHEAAKTELENRLKKSQANELKLREQQRAIENEKAELELKVARQIDQEREKILEKAKEQFAIEHDMKDAEKNKQIDDLRLKITELKRKAEQGSQQLQGEVQELALESHLEAEFRFDEIVPIKKGVNGADCKQIVFNEQRQNCGQILYESKRAKQWSQSWIEKVKVDQRNANASFAVIVSEVLPKGISNFGLVDGVWVTNWTCIKGLATALRSGLLELSRAEITAEGQGEKMAMVYKYLASQEFQHRVATIVEAFVAMQEDLEKEKRSMATIWKRRSKQLERAISGATSLCGELQGILGTSLPTLEALDLGQIAGEKVSHPKIA